MTTSVEMQPRKEIQGDVPAQDTAAPATFLDEATDDRQEFSLPPVDGGKDAWLFLTACFVMECLVWGWAALSRPRHASTDGLQDSPLRSASSRITTARTSRSRARHTLPSSEPVPW